MAFVRASDAIAAMFAVRDRWRVSHWRARAGLFSKHQGKRSLIVAFFIIVRRAGG